MPVDFKQGKVYQIINEVDDKVYVGSTCNPLSKRFASHRAAFKSKSKQFSSYFHRHARDIGWGTMDIILLEDYPCRNRSELVARERYWIDYLEPELNTKPPCLEGEAEANLKAYRSSARYKQLARTSQKKIYETPTGKAKKQQYYQEHKARKQEYGRQYYERNKEALLAYAQQQRDNQKRIN
jgi:hypothetical protein